MKQDNKNILCAVSAGYSSVLMAIKIKEWYPDHDILFAMANTSKERIESLEFMDKCDKHFGLELNWIESIFNPKRGKGVNYRIVDYKNLKTNGEIFEQGIKKFGIPCMINKWCNREMKNNSLKKFADNIFGLNNYSIAIGYRADEIDRAASDFLTNNHIYPLIDKGITTRDRNKFWKDKSIQITIPAYKGNCDLCFEKSRRKLMTIITEEPESMEWWQRMTDKYSQIPLPEKDSYNAYAENGGMNFFRQNESLQDLIELSKQPFSKATDEYIYENDLFDQEGDCGSGCKVF